MYYCTHFKCPHTVCQFHCNISILATHLRSGHIYSIFFCYLISVLQNMQLEFYFTVWRCALGPDVVGSHKQVSDGMQEPCRPAVRPPTAIISLYECLYEYLCSTGLMQWKRSTKLNLCRSRACVLVAFNSFKWTNHIQIKILAFDVFFWLFKGCFCSLLLQTEFQQC